MKYLALASAVSLFLNGWTPFGWLALILAAWMHYLEETDESELGS